MATSFSERLRKAKGKQARVLAGNRERAVPHVQETPVEDAEPVDSAQLYADLNEEFDVLFDPVMEFWGCSEDERKHILTEWRREGVIEHIVKMWQTQAITYDLPLPQPSLARAYATFRSEVMVPAEAARKAADNAAEKSPDEATATTFASESAVPPAVTPKRRFLRR